MPQQYIEIVATAAANTRHVSSPQQPHLSLVVVQQAAQRLGDDALARLGRPDSGLVGHLQQQRGLD